ncbi:RNA polymerase alpha subunit C-terminal domain-containing protein [Bacillus sp. RO1]|uniref:RNA polymerase alpha subunit C-terminal domain-containing protein n=1 Tax=Bacillus sp. RO1 TaxID=2722703 RepID=UPI0014569258|nr:RNA polymerase alpha subunit C-terminal domain-containing protein [Bacillus sp. RO1]NLP52905.1 hypothetical protein [Bacillus sp. RO1]
MTNTKSLRTCDQGHQYYKSSDCPTCPICEKGRKIDSGFLSLLAAPARRALENNDIMTLEQLSRYTEKEILQLHGMGPASIPKLKAALREVGFSFRN